MRRAASAAAKMNAAQPVRIAEMVPRALDELRADEQGDEHRREQDQQDRLQVGGQQLTQRLVAVEVPLGPGEGLQEEPPVALALTQSTYQGLPKISTSRNATSVPALDAER